MDLRRSLRDSRQRMLLKLARMGQEEAFTLLYGELYPAVAAYISRRVKRSEDAEDLTSLVFHRLLAKLDSYSGGRASVMTWVMGMAHNCIIDHHRRLGAHGGARSKESSLTSMAEVLTADHEDVLGSMIADEERSRLKRALRRQSPETQEMFALRYGQGMNLKEVAAVMGLGEDAVKQRFARTIRKLRLELRAEERKPAEGGAAWAATD